MIYCISDIHGMLDPLKNLIWRLEDKHDITELVFLGDYIDYGPNSKEVVDYLLALPYTKTLLAGNHEDLLLQCLHADIREKNFTDSFWLRDNDGFRTVRSFMPSHSNSPAEFAMNLDECYLTFFANLQYVAEREIAGQKYLFSHANPCAGGKFSALCYLEANNFKTFHAYLAKNDVYGALSPVNYRPYQSYESKDDDEFDKIGEYIAIHGHTPVQTIVNVPKYIEKFGIPLFEANKAYEAVIQSEAEYISETTHLSLPINSVALCGVNIDTGASLGEALSAFGIDEKGPNGSKRVYTVTQALTGGVNRHSAELREFLVEVG